MTHLIHLKNRDHDWLRNLRGLIIDMDGTLWQGEQPLPGLIPFFDILSSKNIRFVLATNNPSQSIAHFATKASRMGIHLSSKQVLSSVTVTIHFLTEHFPPASPVYVIGEPFLIKLILEAGFQISDREAVAVIVSMDEGFTYEKLRCASLLIRAGAVFIGTSPDGFAPGIDGLEPATGAILAALEASTDRHPLIMGKPEHWMYDFALEQMQLSRSEVASLGDRLDTDILGAQQAGLHSILVMTGVTTPEILIKSNIQPDLVCADIWEIARVLEGISPTS